MAVVVDPGLVEGMAVAVAVLVEALMMGRVSTLSRKRKKKKNLPEIVPRESVPETVPENFLAPPRGP